MSNAHYERRSTAKRIRNPVDVAIMESSHHERRMDGIGMALGWHWDSIGMDDIGMALGWMDGMNGTIQWMWQSWIVPPRKRAMHGTR